MENRKEEILCVNMMMKYANEHKYKPDAKHDAVYESNTLHLESYVLSAAYLHVVKAVIWSSDIVRRGK